MTSNLRHTYQSLLVKNLTNSSNPEHHLTAQLDYQALSRGIWKNIERTNAPSNGLRLTGWGLTLFKEFFDHWENQLDLETVPTLHLTRLDRAISTPYFINETLIVLFDAEIAFKFKLVNQLDTFLNMFR